MQRGWISILILLLILADTGIGQVFVSPGGEDSNAGTAGKPVASVGRAVQLARGLSGSAKRVVLLPGQYFDTGIELTSADSGLVLESRPGNSATLIGGVLLSGWQTDGPHFWSATLPSGRAWDVRMLQVNGRFCPRARFPEQGTLTHSSVFKVPWM